MPDIRCIVPSGDHCGEAALWWGTRNALFWTDVNRFLVHCYNCVDGSVRSWLFDQPCVALALTQRQDALVVALGSGLILWEPEQDKRSNLPFSLVDWPDVRLNDAGVGPGGELWIGSMANNVSEDGSHHSRSDCIGKLYRIDGNAEVTEFRAEIGISNTVCFSPDHRYFYFGDTQRNVIWRYEYDMINRSISDPIPFFEGFDRGLPDGSTVDEEGFLWNCRFGGGCILRVSPDGAVNDVIELPVSNPTTCAFGGPSLDTLFVTTANILLDHHERLAGGLFALTPGARGLSARHMKLNERLATCV
jgi:sugar lactone lactonase YvrE